DRFFERLGTEQTLQRSRPFLERLLRVIRHFGSDRLESLRSGAKAVQRRLDIVLPELLHVIERLHHGQSSSRPPKRRANTPIWTLTGLDPASFQRNIVQCTI